MFRGRVRAFALMATVVIVGMVAGATLAAGQSDPITIERGIVRLHLGDSDTLPDRDYFRFDPGTAGSGYAIGTEQPIATTSGCRLDEPGPLVALSSNAGHVGFKDDTIGVRINGSQGVPCGQVNGLDEQLRLRLVDDPAATDDELAGYVIDYAEIDLGAKFDVTIEMDLYLDGVYVGSPAPVVCAASDCGPDSKDRDNVRKIIDGFQFDEIVFRVSASTPSAAFSLEGGADGTAAGPVGLSLATSDTLFRVVETFDGVLDCGDTTPAVGDGSTSPLAQFTRYENVDGTPCELKPYNLDSVVTGGEEVRFHPDGGQQAAYSGALTFLPEDGTVPFSIDGLDYDAEGDGVYVPMPWCDEALIVDGTGTVTSDPLPPGDTWCILDATAVTVGGSPVQFQTTWSVYGEDDPNIRPR